MNKMSSNFHDAGASARINHDFREARPGPGCLGLIPDLLKQGDGLGQQFPGPRPVAGPLLGVTKPSQGNRLPEPVADVPADRQRLCEAADRTVDLLEAEI